MSINNLICVYLDIDQRRSFKTDYLSRNKHFNQCVENIDKFCNDNNKTIYDGCFARYIESCKRWYNIP